MRGALLTDSDLQLLVDDVIRYRYLADGICRFIQELVVNLEKVTRERDALIKTVATLSVTVKLDSCIPPSS